MEVFIGKPVVGTKSILLLKATMAPPRIATIGQRNIDSNNIPEAANTRASSELNDQTTANAGR